MREMHVQTSRAAARAKKRREEEEERRGIKCKEEHSFTASDHQADKNIASKSVKGARSSLHGQVGITGKEEEHSQE